eukprot:6959881-Karenia_brevis.AAC.1
MAPQGLFTGSSKKSVPPGVAPWPSSPRFPTWPPVYSTQGHWAHRRSATVDDALVVSRPCSPLASANFSSKALSTKIWSTHGGCC